MRAQATDTPDGKPKGKKGRQPTANQAHASNPMTNRDPFTKVDTQPKVEVIDLQTNLHHKKIHPKKGVINLTILVKGKLPLTGLGRGPGLHCTARPARSAGTDPWGGLMHLTRPF